MARMTLSYSDLYTKVSNFLGLTATGTAPSGTDLTTCKDIVHRGIRQFLYPIDGRNEKPYYWSFLSQYWSFTTANGKWKYALPIDFSDLLDDFSYEEDEGLPPLQKRSRQQIKRYGAISDTSGWPEYFAIVPVRYDIEIGTLYELWLYPTPGQSYTLSTFYQIDPIKLSATTDLAIGGISACEAILESCLGVAELQEEDSTSVIHQQKAEELIQKLIRFDSGKTSTAVVGNLYKNRFMDVDERSLFLRDISTDDIDYL